MKNIFILLLTTALFAGGYGYNTANVDIYDIDTGLYYKSISNKQEKSGFIFSAASDYQIVNINIYNPKTNKSRMIFKTYKQNIIGFLFEMEYHNKSISFNQTYEHIKNNNNIEKRAPKDKLLISTL
jgi:hypothetical protein